MGKGLAAKVREMTTVLHLHLEPSIRKARLRGTLNRPSRGRDDFFRSHELGGQRDEVSLAELESFLRDLQAEQRCQRVSYAEVRISPQRFIASGYDLGDILAAASRAALRSERPQTRLVLLVNRNSPDELIDLCSAAIEAGLPPGFVGVDLAGDEIRHPEVTRFQQLFALARLAGLGTTVHAGEFGDAANVWKALDLLGADRIGHGVAIGGNRALAQRLVVDKVIVEASVSSNLALGAVSSLAAHPLPWLVGQGIDVCVNTDIPLETGCSIAHEMALAADLLRHDHDALRILRDAAERHAFVRAVSVPPPVSAKPHRAETSADREPRWPPS